MPKRPAKLKPKTGRASVTEAKRVEGLYSEMTNMELVEELDRKRTQVQCIMGQMNAVMMVLFARSHGDDIPF